MIALSLESVSSRLRLLNNRLTRLLHWIMQRFKSSEKKRADRAELLDRITRLIDFF